MLRQVKMNFKSLISGKGLGWRTCTDSKMNSDRINEGRGLLLMIGEERKEIIILKKKVGGEFDFDMMTDSD